MTEIHTNEDSAGLFVFLRMTMSIQKSWLALDQGFVPVGSGLGFGRMLVGTTKSLELEKSKFFTGDRFCGRQ